MTIAEQIAELRVQIADLEAQIDALLNPPVELPELPEFIQTHHDNIPVLGRKHTKHVARSGKWSDPGTWSPRGLPTAKDRVRIQAGRTVLLDTNGEADVLLIDGGLTVNPAMATRLTVTTLFGLPSGMLEAKVSGSFECVFRDAPFDLTEDPSKYGHGLLWLGKFEVHGRPKAAYADMLTDIRQGENFLGLGEVPAGWEVGDEILVHDTRQLAQKERVAGYTQIERRLIRDLPKDGEIGVTVAFQFDHVPGKADDGNRDVPIRVSNLTRNIVFRAEVPGTAHAQFFDHAHVDIRFASFQGMGRTTNAPLDAVNLIGRYPVHMHHVHHEFVLEGVVVDQGDAPHDRKWGIVGHGAKGRITECVVFNTVGAGIMMEDGSEQVAITRNSVCRVTGIGGRVVDVKFGHGRQGTGIYLSGPFCDVEGNHVSNVDAAGGKPYAYAYALAYNRLGKVTLDGVVVNGNGGGGGVFKDNVAFACQSGMVPWWVGYGSPRPAEPKETLIESFTTVNHWRHGVFQYPLQHVTFLKLTMRGDRTAAAWTGADYLARDLVIMDPDIQGQRAGILFSTNDGPQTVRGGRIRAKEVALVTTALWNVSANGAAIVPRDVVIDGTVLEAPSLIERRRYLGDTRNLVARDTLTVRNFQGKPGDNFKVYALEQAPDFVVPETIWGTQTPPLKRLVGAPEPGLTNAECLAKHGVAIGGEVAPCSTQRPGVVGFCCKP